jgi:hypothetical protein
MNLFPNLDPLTRDVVELLILAFVLFWPALFVWIGVKITKRIQKRKR